jgi:hypothetical protein
MRWDKTNEFLSSIDDTRQSKLMPQGNKREKKDKQISDEHLDTIIAMKEENPKVSVRAMCRKTGLSDTRIYKLLAEAGLE